jgi:hypothetical protein
MITKAAILFLVGASVLSSCTGGNSYEELFMGFRRPFSQREPQPMPATTPAGSAKALYKNEIFFHLRNSFEKPITDYLSPCLTTSLMSHFEANQKAMNLWRECYQGSKLKMPMAEGPVFVGCYDGATSFRIGETVMDGDKARVAIHLVYSRWGTRIKWTDFALFKRSADRWLLDDIIFNPSKRHDSTLRKRTTLGRH